MRSYFVIALLLAAATYTTETNAIQLTADLQFTDDLEKALTKDEPQETLAQKKTEEKTEQKKEEKVEKKVDEKKSSEKKDKKKVEEDIPMDAAAIKAYSSVIADAAEDSEPEKPIVYGQISESDQEKRAEHAPTA